ncbi:carbohydrate binding domain-containing protein [Nonomuraea sp. 10N515B]|uniref:carbohydrate binding domain-containing protein n=1 Tax=Nonomuraea sp. 10N515B TaxID=3457422 RepID=UPI003FCE8FDE
MKVASSLQFGVMARLGVLAIVALLCAVTVIPGTARADNPIVQTIYTAESITGRTASWNGTTQDVTTKLTNGKSYTTSVWVRSQSGTPGAKAAGTDGFSIDDASFQ